MIKKKEFNSKAFIITAVTLMVFCIAVLGSIFPIYRTEAMLCGGKPKRLTLAKNELGQFLEMKTRADKLNNILENTNINIDARCTSSNSAELYVF